MFQLVSKVKYINPRALFQDQDKAKTWHCKVKGKGQRSINLYTSAYRETRQQRFTMRSGVLTSISSRQRSAISGRPLPEHTNY